MIIYLPTFGIFDMDKTSTTGFVFFIPPEPINLIWWWLRIAVKCSWITILSHYLRLLHLTFLYQLVWVLRRKASPMAILRTNHVATRNRQCSGVEGQMPPPAGRRLATLQPILYLTNLISKTNLIKGTGLGGPRCRSSAWHWPWYWRSGGQAGKA